MTLTYLIADGVPVARTRTVPAQYWPYTFDQWYEAHNSFRVVPRRRG